MYRELILIILKELISNFRNDWEETIQWNCNPHSGEPQSVPAASPKHQMSRQAIVTAIDSDSLCRGIYTCDKHKGNISIDIKVRRN